MTTDAILRFHWPWGTLLAAGLVALGLTSGSGCSKEAPLSDLEYTERAQDYVDKGETPTALIELKNALQQNPENVEARRLLGEVYLKLGNSAAAQKELEQALAGGMPRSLLAKPLAHAYLLQQEYRKITEEIALDEIAPGPDRGAFLITRGKAQQALGKPEQAQADFQDALKEQPNSWQAMLELGWLTLAQGDSSKAKTWLDQAMGVAPGQADVWVLQGSYQLNQGQIQEGEASFRNALALKPTDFNARLGLTTTLLQQNRPDEARQELNSFQGAARNHPEVHYRLGLAAYQKDEYQAAQAHFQEVTRIQPNNIRAFLLLSAINYALGHLEQADTAIQQVLSQNNQLLPARKLQAAIQLRRHQPQKASGLLKSALTQAPEDRQLLAMLGEAAIKTGDVKTAVAAIQKVAAATPQEGSAESAKHAVELLKVGNTAGALSALEFALDEMDDSVKLRIAEIQNQLRQKQYDQALEGAQKLIKDFPQKPWPFNLLAAAQLGKGEIEAAKENFKKALAIQPSFTVAATNLGSLELATGNLEEARKYYLQVLEQTPSHLVALQQLVRIDERLGRLAETQPWLERAIRADPTAKEPREWLATYYLRAGQPAQALAVFHDTQERYQNDPNVLKLIGTAQLATNQPISAVATFKRWIQVAPQSAEAHYFLAHAYGHNQVKDVEKAREELNKVLALEPEHFNAQLSLARLLVSEGKLEQAQQWLERLKKNHSEHSDILNLEGQLALLRKRPEDAVAAYRKGLERFQTGAWAMSLATAQWHAGHQESTVATLEKWVQDHPDDVSVRSRLAATYQILNRPDQAKITYREVLAKFPNSVEALTNLAILIGNENPDQALQYAERALAIAPQVPQVKDTLAMLLLNKGQTDRALRLLKEAHAELPSNAKIRLHLAQGLARSGDKAGARKLLEGLVQEQPVAQEAQALLEQLGK